MVKKKKKQKTRVTHCEICGRKLSKYNNIGICFFHQYKKDHDGGKWSPPAPSVEG